MNTKYRILKSTAVAALSVGLTASALAQAPQSGTRVGSSASETSGALSTDTSRHSAALGDASSSIGKINKASSLIGMDVRNTQNEKLGEIKDLVVDLSSGKVAYAVLSVGGFLGIGDKYIAVPTSAFTVAPDQDRVTLNADKARIQNAPGFAKSAWPEINSSSWTTDSSYWLDSAALGTAGASVRSGTGTDRARSGLDHDSDRLRSTTTPSASTTTTTPNRVEDPTVSTTARTPSEGSSALSSDKNTFRGKITAINPENRTMTVEGPSGTRDFKFTEKPNLTLKENRNPTITDLKVGYPVTVGYHEENGNYLAHSVTRSDTPEVR